MASITCGNCKQTHSSANAVRACYSNTRYSKDRAATASANTQFNLVPNLPTAPATLDIKPAPAPESKFETAVKKYSQPGRSDISMYAKAPTVTEGIYRKNGEVYKVSPTKRGRLVAKILRGHSFQYKAGAVYDLDLKDKVTIEEAEQYGFDTGNCICCGRTLTNPESVKRGIGPICLGKYF